MSYLACCLPRRNHLGLHCQQSLFCNFKMSSLGPECASLPPVLHVNHSNTLCCTLPPVAEPRLMPKRVRCFTHAKVHAVPLYRLGPLQPDGMGRLERGLAKRERRGEHACRLDLGTEHRRVWRGRGKLREWHRMRWRRRRSATGVVLERNPLGHSVGQEDGAGSRGGIPWLCREEGHRVGLGGGLELAEAAEEAGVGVGGVVEVRGFADEQRAAGRVHVVEPVGAPRGRRGV